MKTKLPFRVELSKMAPLAGDASNRRYFREARISQEYRSEAVETEACRCFSQVRTTQAYPQRYIEEGEREKRRRARGSGAAVGIPE